jgi:hypothetical protein
MPVYEVYLVEILHAVLPDHGTKELQVSGSERHGTIIDKWKRVVELC